MKTLEEIEKQISSCFINEFSGRLMDYFKKEASILNIVIEFSTQEVTAVIKKQNEEISNIDIKLQLIANQLLSFDISTDFEKGQLNIISLVQNYLKQFLSTSQFSDNLKNEIENLRDDLENIMNH